MTKKLEIFGAAHAYCLQTIEAVNRATPTWEILGFLDVLGEIGEKGAATGQRMRRLAGLRDRRRHEAG